MFVFLDAYMITPVLFLYYKPSVNDLERCFNNVILYNRNKPHTANMPSTEQRENMYNYYTSLLTKIYKNGPPYLMGTGRANIYGK